MSALPHQTRLYADFLAQGETDTAPLPEGWYAAAPRKNDWMGRAVKAADGPRLAELLTSQAKAFGAAQPALDNIARLGQGARAIVTGQQVGLFGGPLLTLLKAATAIARARQAEAATGVAHVPVFWLATEDHDLAEVDQLTLPGKTTLQTLRMGHVPFPGVAMPAGRVMLPGQVNDLLDQADELLGYGPACDWLRECYGAGPSDQAQPTYGSAFARWLTGLFAAHGLVVMDPAERGFHALGAAALRHAILHAEELEAALLARTAELEGGGYHAQVLVKPRTSLLFLISAVPGVAGAWDRQPLRRGVDGSWRAGGQTFTVDELLAILDAEPERLSPNALLRPVFQDTILPTAAYIGGPAEVAYFAQSAVVYEQVLGWLTPVLPRFSATLVEPAVAATMARHEVSLGDLLAARTAEALALRLGARAMPVEGKRRIAAAGNALDTELAGLTGYMAAIDASLGRSAAVSASKMRYQMNRLRRMAAAFELQREASLGKQAAQMMLQLFPDGHPQERVLGGVWFVARGGDGLIDRLVEEAGQMCLGHTVVRL